MKYVSIVMGSKSDYEVMTSCAETLDSFGVPYELDFLHNPSNNSKSSIPIYQSAYQIKS
jgi:phosphoribosylcarboxyaminoimidazole (NCAIR) mutase